MYTAGDTLSYGTLRRIVQTQAPEKEVREEVWTTENLEKELKEDPNNGILKYRLAFSKGRGVAWSLAQTYNGQRSLPAIDTETWAAKNWRK